MVSTEWRNLKEKRMSKNRALNGWKPAICGVSMLLYAAALFASNIYVAADQAGNVIRLYDEPCEMSTGWLKLKKATFLYQGKDYKACWIIGGSTVLVIDDNGDVTGVPINQFRKQETI